MALALALVTAALAVVIVVVLGTIGRERGALLDRFSAERDRQLAEAAGVAAEEFADVAEDLRFAGELVQAADTAADREREIGTLVAVIKHYRAVRVYDGDGALVLSIHDPSLMDPTRLDDFAADMTRTARAARGRPPGEVQTSRALEADPSGWMRVFAMALPSGKGAIAALVDTEPLVGRLRLLTADGSTRLVVIGAHGNPLPSTDGGIAGLLAAPLTMQAADVGTRLTVAMRSGRAHLFRFDAASARLLGLEAADAVVAVRPIPIPGGDFWSVATISSTATLRAHDRAILRRAIMGAAAAAVCLMAFGIYAVSSARRAATLRERLRHADALAHIHEKTEKILENIPAGVVTISDAGRVTAMNRSLRAQAPDGRLGADLGAALPGASPRALALLVELVSRALATGTVQSALGQRVQLFGAEGRYSLHAVPLEQRFPEARVIVVIDDLTALGELEAQLLAAEKHATVGVLAAGIAHEIGTPLGVARARAEYLGTKLGREHPLEASARVITEQVDRVARTIRQLLDFSRIKPPAVQAVPVGSVVPAVVELLRFEAERRRITLRAELADDTPPVAADPDQLQQVLVNLVMNSCDACGEGGAVTIRVTAETVGDRLWVRLEVADTGCGIPEELRHRVFDPFFTTKKRGQGTGLGLTLTAQIVRNHGGHIELDSEPGRGTTVAIRWPIAPAMEVHGAASA